MRAFFPSQFYGGLIDFQALSAHLTTLLTRANISRVRRLHQGVNGAGSASS